MRDALIWTPYLIRSVASLKRWAVLCVLSVEGMLCNSAGDFIVSSMCNRNELSGLSELMLCVFRQKTIIKFLLLYCLLYRVYYIGVR